MGDDRRGGMPVPIDKWSYRDAGYVDAEVKEYVTRKFGASEAARLKLDSFGEDQYEHCVRHYAGLANELNRIGWLGANDWRPHQVEAIGRHSMHVQMGVEFPWPDMLF
ncbi:hypothetical protein M6I34_06020 [Burkholderiaceae bacterium FT117]|uniref:hypothetical protein n=1 Tax=Zeimonas sediminis TaxID=2944268 RepID=UPI0023431C93|nr:hypothetical protein [Zeimonas sediminis]MCM5570058.1 hypothetical protein [Zeimonas sediminis]